MAKKTTPTQRTLQALRTLGMTCQVVERWNPYGGARVNGKPVGNRVDLFGCIDVIAMSAGEGIVGIQACSASSLSARQAKVEAEPRITEWLRAGGRFEVWGWRKVGPRGKAKRWKPLRRQLLLMGDGSQWIEIDD